MWQIKEMEAAYKEQLRDAQASYYPKPEKVWFNIGSDLNPKALRLAYKIDIYASEPESRAYYFVDVKPAKYLAAKNACIPPTLRVPLILFTVEHKPYTQTKPAPTHPG